MSGIDYSNSKRWKHIIEVATQDLLSDRKNQKNPQPDFISNEALETLIARIIADEQLSQLLGHSPEIISFKSDAEKKQFWDKEFNKLKEALIGEYETLKDNIAQERVLGINNSVNELVKYIAKKTAQTARSIVAVTLEGVGAFVDAGAHALDKVGIEVGETKETRPERFQWEDEALRKAGLMKVEKVTGLGKTFRNLGSAVRSSFKKQSRILPVAVPVADVSVIMGSDMSKVNSSDVRVKPGPKANTKSVRS